MLVSTNHKTLQHLFRSRLNIMLLVQVLSFASVHAVMVSEVTDKEITVAIRLWKGFFKRLVKVVYVGFFGCVRDLGREQVQVFPVVRQISRRIECPTCL